MKILFNYIDICGHMVTAVTVTVLGQFQNGSAAAPLMTNWGS